MPAAINFVFLHISSKLSFHKQAHFHKLIMFDHPICNNLYLYNVDLLWSFNIITSIAFRILQLLQLLQR